MNQLQRVGLLVNSIFSSNLHRKQRILNLTGYIFLRIWHFSIEWPITLSNVVQLQAAPLSALIREVCLCSERWQLQRHSYTRCLDKVTVKCSAPNKTLIPSSLKFKEHCTRGGGEKIRTRSLGERPWKATFWQDIVIHPPTAVNGLHCSTQQWTHPQSGTDGGEEQGGLSLRNYLSIMDSTRGQSLPWVVRPLMIPLGTVDASYPMNTQDGPGQIKCVTKIKPKVITLGKGLVVEDEREIRKCGRYSLCIRTIYRPIKGLLNLFSFRKIKNMKMFQLKGKHDIK